MAYDGVRSPSAILRLADGLTAATEWDRLDPATRRAALAEIRNAEWAGLTPPVVKVSPHGAFGQRA